MWFHSHLEQFQEIVKYGKMSLDEKGFGYVFTIDGSINGGEEKLWRLGVNEDLKRTNQIEWVQAMNNIKNRAEETVLSELIYV